MLTINNGQFQLNGEKINIYSGAIHYFRTLPEYWEDRLTKLKLAGFNTVETYCCWNLHEQKRGQFCFTGMLDIERFIQTAQKIGLYVIIRPGPYICAEWDFGGLPAWLLQDKNMRLRCNYEPYLDAVKGFYKELLGRIVKYQATNGGPIIAMQVENEYGSYGNDKEYLMAVEQIMLDCGVNVLLFTSDGPTNWMLSGGTLPHIYKVLNFGSNERGAFKALEGIQDNAPKMCGEFWCGWFDHWGGIHHKRKSNSVVKVVNEFIKLDASFNVYMFHGGTNFAFYAGANYYNKYSPTVTSYDYSALLTEWGDYTPTYHAVREVLCKKQNIELSALPPAPKLQNIGKIQLTECASLFNNLDNIGIKHHSALPESMEYYGQNFGLIYYKTTVKGNYSPSILCVSELADRAYVYFDGNYSKTIYRSKSSLFKKIFKKDTIISPSIKGECEISLLVDAMGRVNYGEKLYDRKGIQGLKLGAQILSGFDVISLPLDNLENLQYDNDTSKYPLFFKGKFKANSQADCFVDMRGFSKGYVFVNGFNLGRYWKIGPQKTLYLPGVLLKEENEIVILELEGNKEKSVSIIDTHLL